eukprot:1187541-Prorocentrum_minimum.AAC.3
MEVGRGPSSAMVPSREKSLYPGGNWEQRGGSADNLRMLAASSRVSSSERLQNTAPLPPHNALANVPDSHSSRRGRYQGPNGPGLMNTLSIQLQQISAVLVMAPNNPLAAGRAAQKMTSLAQVDAYPY